MSKQNVPSSRQRRTVRFIGNVQGVGFRYTTQHIARDFAVTGFVRNRLDGNVEMIVEGDAPEIDRLISAIQGRMERFIRKATQSTEPATGEFTDFAIRH